MAAMSRTKQGSSASSDDLYDFESDGLYYRFVSVSNLTCEVVAGEGKYTDDIAVPSSVAYKGKSVKVVRIAARAFMRCTGLRSVCIGGSVTMIGESAFSSCTKLEQVSLQEGLEEIGREAFHGCASLVSVALPNSVEKIGVHSFDGCTRLEQFCFGNGLKVVFGTIFYGCSNLGTITLGNSIAMEYMLVHKNDFTTLVIADDYSDETLPAAYYYTQYFRLCDNKNLSRIISKAHRPPVWSGAEDDISANQYVNAEVTVPAGSQAVYRKTDIWKNFWNLKDDTNDNRI